MEFPLIRRIFGVGRRKDGGSSAASVGANQGGGGWLPTLGSTPSATGLLISQGTAMAVGAVYACVVIRSQDVARCTPRLFKEKKGGKRERIFEHDVVELFNRPNAQQTWFEFIEQTMSGYLLRGNGYAAKKGITKRGQVDELIPINPDAVLVLESANGEIFYNVARLGLWQMAQLREFSTSLSDEQMLHIKGLSFNALVGLSNIGNARDSIGVAMGLEQQASRWMKNGARPGFLLESAKPLSVAAARRLKQQFDDFKAGLQNTGETVLLEDGITARQLQLTSVDMEFIEQRKFQIVDICRFYRVPPFKLGATELRGIDIEEINNEYVSGTIMPDLHRLEQRIQAAFDLQQQNITVSFDERALLRSATKSRFANNRIGLGGASFLTINEVRAAEGLPEVPEGDVLYQPSNLAALGSDLTGGAPDGAGRPEDGTLPQPSPAPHRNGGAGKALRKDDDMNASRDLLLIRHGATELNNDDVSVDRIRGWRDVPLSDDGKKEAERLGEEICKSPPDYLFSSDLKRASETADIIAVACNMDVTATCKAFRPWNVGVLAGRLSSEVVPMLADYACNKPDEAIEEGESFNDFRNRFFVGLSDVLSRYEGTVAIVTHHRCERLMNAWRNAGFPDDGGIDAGEFSKKGEHTGSSEMIKIPVNPLDDAAEFLDGGSSRTSRVKFIPSRIVPRGLNGHRSPLAG